MGKPLELLKDTMEKQKQAEFLLAATVQAHGGWLVLEPKDLAAIEGRQTTLVIGNGPRKGEILLRLM